MPQVGALSLLLRRDLGWRFTSGNGIATHCVLESGRGEDESQVDGIAANIFQAYPCIRRNKHKSACMKIAFLITQPNVSVSAMEQHYLVLNQVPVLR